MLVTSSASKTAILMIEPVAGSVCMFARACRYFCPIKYCTYPPASEVQMQEPSPKVSCIHRRFFQATHSASKRLA